MIKAGSRRRSVGQFQVGVAAAAPGHEHVVAVKLTLRRREAQVRPPGR